MQRNLAGLATLLTVLGSLIPGDYLKTVVYRGCVAGPRRALRRGLGSFYRFDPIYDVLSEFGTSYAGRFSVLEFGVADGYSFTKLLYATRYMKMEPRVTVHGFDTFEGLPPQEHRADDAVVEGTEWVAGHFRGRYDDLLAYCASKYRNFELHKGLFSDTLTDGFIATLAEHLPIYISIDCDYYSSTRTIFERLMPWIPSGCVVYFDDINYNFSSRFTGEMRLVHEINHGDFGHGVELVPDSDLGWDSNRVYRFINLNARTRHQLVRRVDDPLRRRRDDSPFP